ncbi:MAG: hypothetical protein A4E35_00321 [Methanoregula sp. PtaU1.Bin051]|nr:MAG: hypothetical protein A4E35_00321 [Methanoregula sp. PtaU1.Bin051]
MRENIRPQVHRDIPFFHQHYDYTCGPACLMMSMQYCNPGMQTGKALEIDLWREGTFVIVYGTSRFGLAYSAAVRGFKARVTSNTGGVDFVDRFIPPLSDKDLETLTYHFLERRARCRKRGVRERTGTITADILYDVLEADHVPLIITSTSYFGREDLPHWVVGTGISDTFLSLNNPLDARKKKREVPLSDLPAFIGYRGSQSMVEGWKE